jgi:hypothetical protein
VQFFSLGILLSTLDKSLGQIRTNYLPTIPYKFAFIRAIFFLGILLSTLDKKLGKK